jgi:hypothetical protein
MEKFRFCLVPLLLLALVGCNASLSLQATNVQLTKNMSEVANCKFLGDVSGEKGRDSSNDSAKDEMKNKAHQLRADVVLYHVTLTGVAGKAYDCGGRFVPSFPE